MSSGIFAARIPLWSLQTLYFPLSLSVGQIITAKRPLKQSALRWTVHVERSSWSAVFVGLCDRGGARRTEPLYRSIGAETGGCCLHEETAPFGLKSQQICALFSESASSYALSVEADLVRGRLFMWLDGRLLGCAYDDIPALGDMFPAIAIGGVLYPGSGQRVRLLDSPSETVRSAANED
jgi:hypothetical protein